MIYRKLLVAISLALGLLAAPAFGGDAAAQTYEDGLVAFDRGDFATAARIWEPLAVGGNAKAQHGLGMLYESGQGVRARDYERAAQLYGQAARQGITAAVNNLALMYSDGRGVAQDYAEAYRLWKIAADQGHPMAQFNLGLMFFRGQGLSEPDYNEAAWWFGKAAENGSVDAQFAMGELNARGLGMPQNLGEAERWYRLAAGAGHPTARQRLEALQAGTLEAAAPASDASSDPTADEAPPADPATADAPTDEMPLSEEAAATPDPVSEPGNVETVAEATAGDADAEPEPEAVVEDQAVPELDSGVLIPPPVIPDSAQPTTSPGASTGAASTGAATQAEPAATQEVAAPPAPVASPDEAEPAAMPDGVFVLLGREATPVAAEQRWSILKVAFPGILGSVSPLMVPSGDGAQLILGGPLASADEGTAICTELRKRDNSVECQVIEN